MLEQAAATFVDDLPDGLDTVVGEQGLTLSGGQRQRVALARALLADPDVLILDDPTSAVDPQTETSILAALRERRPGTTTVLVAHRRSTLALADPSRVLDGGRVVDVGTRGRARRASPLFRSLSLRHRRRDDLPRELDEIDPDARDHPGGLAGPGDVAASVRLFGGAEGAPSPRLAKLVERPSGGDGRTADRPRRRPHRRPATSACGRLLRPLRAALLIGLLLVAADALAQLMLPALVRRAVDSGVSEHATVGAVRHLAGRARRRGASTGS